jgi:hypothetical protein
MTYAGRLNLDEHLVVARLVDIDIDDLKRRFRFESHSSARSHRLFLCAATSIAVSS